MKEEVVIFYCDFRSSPSGLGSYGEDILVQDEGSCPEIADDLYNEIIKLNYNACESKENYAMFIDFLMEKGVTHIYDPEIENNELRRKYKDYCYPIDLYKTEAINSF